MAILVLAARDVRADEVHLKTGARIQGRVVRADRDEVVVETGGGQQTRWPRGKVMRIELAQPAGLRLADDLFANGHYAAAADAYQRAAEALPPGLLRERARGRLIEALLAEGAEARAVGAFLQVLADDPQSPLVTVLVPFGRPLRDAGGVLATLEPRERTLARDQAVPILQALQFWACLEHGDTPTAQRLAADLAGAAEGRFGGLAAVCRGWLAYRVKGPAEAVALIEPLRPRLDPLARPHGELLLARCFADLGRPRERLAAALYIAFGYEDLPLLAAEGLYHAGRAFADLDEPRRARAMFKTLVERHPASFHAPDARRRMEKKWPVASEEGAGDQ